jgi:hypothetical protein
MASRLGNGMCLMLLDLAAGAFLVVCLSLTVQAELALTVACTPSAAPIFVVSATVRVPVLI